MKRILVIVTRQIGDVLLTTPLIRAAHDRWPDARIDVLGFEGTLEILTGNPDIANRIEVDATAGWRARFRLLRRLWRRYDLALVAEASDRAHVFGWIASDCRCGLVPEQGRSNWWKRRALAHATPVAGDRGAVHVVVEKLALLRPWREADDAIPALVPPAGRALPADIADRLEAGAVVVHAPSMWRYKQWPPEHFAGLVRALLAQGRQVILTGSGSDRDQRCIAPLLALGRPPALLDTSGRLDFPQLASLLRQVGMYVGPDTSVSHLAAAVGARVVALFGPTNPQRWAPWPAHARAQHLFERSAGRQTISNVTLLQGHESCIPCGRAGCEDHRDSAALCLPQITVARVLAALDFDTAATRSDDAAAVPLPGSTDASSTRTAARASP